MQISLSERDLLAKIGELVLVNEALTARVRELEAEEVVEDDVRGTED